MAKETFEHNQQAVQTHLGILQGVIERMAANSSSAKAWCITLVSAILVIVADKNKPRFVWLTLIPTVLFLLLDAYYLALERGFRAAYRQFVERLHRETLSESDFFAVEPIGSFPSLYFGALFSWSVWPIYVTLAVMTYIAYRLI